MFPERLTTDRLVLEQLSASTVDVFELYELFAAGTEGVAGVFEYVPQEPYATVKEASDQLGEAEAAWEDLESAEYAVFTADGDLAGYTGLFLEWDRQTGRFGATLGRPFWGEGYAGECARRLAALAFDRLDLEVVAIGYEAGNERSKRAVERFIDGVGGQYEGRLRNWTPLDDRVANHHRYTVTADQYGRATADD